MIEFVKNVFSDNGSASYSRCASGVIVLATIGFAVHELIHFHTVPDLANLAMFLSSGVGVHYGSNKLPDIMAAFKKTS